MKSISTLSNFLRMTAITAAAVLLYMPAQAQVIDDAEIRPSGARSINIVSTTAQAGTQVNVSVEMDSQGDEAAISFSLSFDPAVFSNPVVTLGSGAPGGATATSNVNQAAQGRIGVLVDSLIAFGVSPPNRQVVNVRFDIAPSASGTSSINFSQQPTPGSVANVQGALLSSIFQAGSVTISPIASMPITLGGRVTSPTGQNLRNVVVTLTDGAGNRRVATTSSFGIYSFTNVPSGLPYTLTISSKRYRFSPKNITPAESNNSLDFVGLE